MQDLQALTFGGKGIVKRPKRGARAAACKWLIVLFATGLDEVAYHGAPGTLSGWPESGKCPPRTSRPGRVSQNPE